MVSYKALNTTHKSTVFNIFYTIGDIYVSEGFTTAKSTISNSCHTIGDIYVSEGFTIAKTSSSIFVTQLGILMLVRERHP